MFRKSGDNFIRLFLMTVFVPVGGECFVNLMAKKILTKKGVRVFVPVGGECFVNNSATSYIIFDGKTFSSPLGVSVS